MNEEVAELLRELVAMLKTNHPCRDNCCDDCTTARTFEQTAARANEQAAFAAAESNKAFVQQQGAAFAQLLKQQA